MERLMGSCWYDTNIRGPGWDELRPSRGATALIKGKRYDHEQNRDDEEHDM